MVTFQLIFKDKSAYLYEYFPDGDTSKKGGVIKLDMIAETISIVEIAEGDFLRIVDTEELKESRNSLNELCKEEGLPLLSEEDFSTEEELRWYYYGSHALNRIWKDFSNGNLRDQGTVMWG